MRVRGWRRLAGMWCMGFTVAAPLAAVPAQAQDYRALLNAPDRSAADRENDKRRDPTDMLSFIQPRAGMKILDMGAGAGYSTDLMARAAGESGTVYGQNPPDQFERLRQGFDARFKGSALKVSQDVRPYDDPVPPGVRDFDLVTFLFFYHDTAYLAVDRALMNKRLFDALKPGGVVAIADYSARPGDEVASTAKTLHRIDENVVKREMEGAGFRLVAEGDFLRHPEDKRDATSSRSPMPVDEFILKFEKPR